MLLSEGREHATTCHTVDSFFPLKYAGEAHIVSSNQSRKFFEKYQGLSEHYNIHAMI